MKELLRLSHIVAGFDGKVVLEDVNLSLVPNEFLVLTGANGGGKTTLLRVIAGLLAPMRGERWVREGLTIGYLPQYRSIDRQFPITVGQVVLSGLQNRKSLWGRFSKEHKERCKDVLRRFDLEHLYGRPIDALSGGQWQRVLLARAIVSQPDVLLLDEPDTHLDRRGKSFLYDLIERERKTSAVVLVSHDEHAPVEPDRLITL